MNAETAAQIFGVRLVQDKVKRGKKEPDTIEGGNNQFKLVSKNWSAPPVPARVVLMADGVSVLTAPVNQSSD